MCHEKGRCLESVRPVRGFTMTIQVRLGVLTSARERFKTVVGQACEGRLLIFVSLFVFSSSLRSVMVGYPDLRRGWAEIRSFEFLVQPL